MYLLKANVPRSLVHDLTDALIALGVLRIRLAEVSGYTDGIEQERLYRGRRLLVQLVQEVELEALVPNESVDRAVDATLATIRRARNGDGFISVAPLEHCYRVSTGNPEM
jgi:nitrogen regulatory protein P-II 1/nitrogen regulatory protein P-II 2